MFEEVSVSYVLNTWVFPVLRLTAVLAVGIVLAFVAAKVIINVCNKSSVDYSLSKFLANVTRITILCLTAIAFLSILGIPTTGLIAAFSAVAVAISLALKDSLSNVSGGIFLLMTRPFVTGDFITVSGDAGTVKEIKLVHTVIVTPDAKEVIVPNSVMMNSTVTNLSNEEKRRVDLVFSISYDSDVELAREIILKNALKHEATLTEPAEPFARVTEHESNGIKISCRVWCLAGNYWTLYFDMLDSVRKDFNASGIKIPFNQLDVHVDGALNK